MSNPVPGTVRVIVTGSRHWSDEDPIADALRRLRGKHGDQLLVVHGDCRTGADRIARELCRALDIRQERHPADWDRHGRAAGPIRNRAMVAQGADLVLAYVEGESRGTRGLIALAELAGIEVRVTDAAPTPATGAGAA